MLVALLAMRLYEVSSEAPHRLTMGEKCSILYLLDKTVRPFKGGGFQVTEECPRFIFQGIYA